MGEFTAPELAAAHPVARAEDTTTPGGVRAEARGVLTVADRAIGRVATAVASEVLGVVRVDPATSSVMGSRLSRALGRGYPRAQVTQAGHRAQVSLAVAVAWPHPLSATAVDVRDRVRERLQTLLDLEVDMVDVTATPVLVNGPKPTDSTRGAQR
ncbi:MAG: Asp23/Gls24 family envelope stress response protein [Angustibacter sp.]